MLKRRVADPTKKANMPIINAVLGVENWFGWFIQNFIISRPSLI
jgi:hypothetical protein